MPDEGSKPGVTSADEFLRSVEKTWEAPLEKAVRSYYKDYSPEEIQEKVNKAVETEYEFASAVISSYEKWSIEEGGRALVLWDVDDTMATVVWKESPDGAETPVTKIRPILLPLMEYLQKKYPGIHNGILSNRTEILSQFEDPESLERLKFFFDLSHLYSSRDVPVSIGVAHYLEEHDIYTNPDAEQKLMVVETLRDRGYKVKLIDDNKAANLLGSDGLCVYDLMARSY